MEKTCLSSYKIHADNSKEGLRFVDFSFLLFGELCFYCLPEEEKKV